MSLCDINFDTGPVVIFVSEQLKKNKYILNLFLTDFFNLPITRIKQIGGVIAGYFYELKYLEDAIKARNLSEVYRILATVIRNGIILANRINYIRQSYMNKELLETGLFKLIIDPHIPLGFYITIGKLLRKGTTFKLQKIYLNFYMKLLKQRVITRPIFNLDYENDDLQVVKVTVKRTFGNLLKEAVNEFIIKRMKDEIKSLSPHAEESYSDLEDALRLFISYNSLRKPLGILLYHTVLEHFSMENTEAGSVRTNKGFYDLYRKNAFSSLTNLSDASVATRYWMFLKEAPVFLYRVKYPDKYKSGDLYPESRSSWSDDYTEVLDSVSSRDTFVYFMPIIPLDVFSIMLEPRDSDVDASLETKLKFNKEAENQAIANEGVQYKNVYEKIYNINEENVFDELMKASKSKQVYTSILSSIKKLLASSKNNKEKLNLLSHIILPLGGGSYDLARVAALINNDADILGILSSINFDKRNIPDNNFEVNERDDNVYNTDDKFIGTANRIRKLIEPLSFFVYKGVEIIRNYLSISDLASNDLVMVSLEPFSYFIPELPEVYCVDWLEELVSSKDGIDKDNLIFNPNLCIYRDILPIAEFSLKYDDIESETISMYNKKIDVPGRWEAFIPKINISIIDTTKRHMYNYFNEYRKRVFIKGAVRPPLDISFILDVIRIRADFAVQDFISLIVVPTSIDIPGIDYNSEGHFIDKLETVNLEFSVIGFINYTDVLSSIKVNEVKEAQIDKYPQDSSGNFDYTAGFYNIPSFYDMRVYNERASNAHELARLASDVALLNWYMLYNSVPGNAEYIGLGENIHFASVNRILGKKPNDIIRLGYRSSFSEDKDRPLYQIYQRVKDSQAKEDDLFTPSTYFGATVVEVGSNSNREIWHNNEIVRRIMSRVVKVSKNEYLINSNTNPISIATFGDTNRYNIYKELAEKVIAQFNKKQT